jgi:hypothetical protein
MGGTLPPWAVHLATMSFNNGAYAETYASPAGIVGMLKYCTRWTTRARRWQPACARGITKWKRAPGDIAAVIDGTDRLNHARCRGAEYG